MLPSGRRVRGRSLRAPAGPRADLTVVPAGRSPEPLARSSPWVHWPDFRLPSCRAAARAALQEAWERAADERVEVACAGRRGRTGTALACLALLDGVPPQEAVAFVRRRYDRRAVETPWQRRYVERFG